MLHILVANVGSTSLKYKFVNTQSGLVGIYGVSGDMRSSLSS